MESYTSPVVDPQSGPSVGPLLSAVLGAGAATQELIGSDRFAETVESLVEVAAGMGHHFLRGASSSGDQVVGAMILRNDGLKPWVQGDCVPVLLVDAVIAGVSGLAVAAGQARALGATQVDALVVGVPANVDLVQLKAVGLEEVRTLERGAVAATRACKG